MTLPALTLWFHGPSDGGETGLVSSRTDRDRAERVRVISHEPAPTTVDALRAGGERAFALLFHAHAAELVRYATGLVRTSARAEEAVQDAFLFLWDHRVSLTVRGNLRAYLFGIVRHRCVDLIRRDRAEERITSQPFDVPVLPWANDSLEYAELDRRVRDALATLSPRVREVITLRIRDELTYPEIADVLGVALKTVEAHMTNGLRRLRADLADLRPEGRSKA